MSCAVSRKNPGAGRAPLDPTGAPRGDHEPGREQKDERRGQQQLPGDREDLVHADPDRKSTRLNSSHSQISYAVFCLKKKKKKKQTTHNERDIVETINPRPYSQ